MSLLRFAFSIAITASFCSAASAAGDYDAARRALTDGEYDLAAKQAGALVERSPSEAAYRLLALAQSRLDKPAEAAWALRSAAALGAPTAQAMIVEEVYATLPPELRPLPRRGIDAVAGALTRSAVPQLPAFLALLGAALLAGLSIRLLVAPSRPTAIPFYPSFGLLSVLLGLSLWVAFRQNALSHPAEAVVLATAPFREAPSGGAPVLRELPAGAVLTTGEQIGNFLSAETPTGKRGWVDVAVVRPVAPLGAG